MVGTLLLIIHILVAVLICIVILMQSSKGEGLSGAFGMGQGTTSFFGADTANVLVKITTVLAVIFMLTSLSLAYYQAQRAKSVTAEGAKPQGTDSVGAPPGDDDETTAPDDEAVTPDGETTTPDGETTTPDGETTTPDGEATAPDGGTTTAPDGETPTVNDGDEAAGTGETPDGARDSGPDEPTEPGPTDS